MKTLVLIFHPDLVNSPVDLQFAETVELLPKTTVRRLYDIYTDGKIDILKERSLLEHAGRIVIQFPFENQEMPALLSEWLNKVLTSDWHEVGEKLLLDKEIVLVTNITTTWQKDERLDQCFQLYEEITKKQGAKLLKTVLLSKKKTNPTLSEDVDKLLHHLIENH